MLPRAHRLTSGRGFALAVRRGRRSAARTVVVHLWHPEAVEAAPEPVATQVGFVVSKAVGNAVERNQVKRRLRALLAERLERLPAASVVAIRALPAAAGRSSAALGRDLDRALGRLLDEVDAGVRQ